jgi:hypothetical protein
MQVAGAVILIVAGAVISEVVMLLADWSRPYSIVFAVVLTATVAAMFSGYAKSPGYGCLTMIVFGLILWALAALFVAQIPQG